jgi:hypothetical protein
MSSLEALLTDLTRDTSTLEAAVLDVARNVRDAVGSLGDRLQALPQDAALRQVADVLIGGNAPAPAATAASGLNLPMVGSVAEGYDVPDVAPAHSMEIDVAPTVTNRFEITIQTDLQDPVGLATRLAEALDLVFARKTGLAISEALRQVKAEMARQGASV